MAEEMSRVHITCDTIIGSDLEIPVGNTLIISPGVKIQFEGYRTVVVAGGIFIEGTRDKPVVFTSVERTRGLRQKSSWKGVEIVGKEAHGVVRHCRFEGAFRNLIWEANLQFDSCQFSKSHYGLYCTRKASPVIKHCTFFQNNCGVVINNASPQLVGNTITENSIGLHLQLSSRALAEGNRIAGNGTDIKSEEGFGKDQHPLSMQYLWGLLQEFF